MKDSTSVDTQDKSQHRAGCQFRVSRIKMIDDFFFYVNCVSVNSVLETSSLSLLIANIFYLFQQCPGLKALHLLYRWLLGWFLESFLLFRCSFCFATERPMVRTSSSVIRWFLIIQIHTHTLISWDRAAV